MHLNIADRVSGKSSSSPSLQSTTTAVTSLARAITSAAGNRKIKLDYTSSSQMGRAVSQRAGKPISAAQISLPVALISTTNMLSYDAPDIAQAVAGRGNIKSIDTVVARKASTVSSHSQSTSDGETHFASDRSSTRSRASHSTDATSVDSMSNPSTSPIQTNLSCYFKSPTSSPITRVPTRTHSRSDSLMSGQSPCSSPLVPSRAPTHSKKAHVLSHQRSVSRVALAPHARQGSTDTPAATLTRTPVSHPFGRELEQLNEAAEEFSSTVRDVELDADMSILRTKGLGNFCATEYMHEIAPLFTRTYGEDLAADTPAWI